MAKIAKNLTELIGNTPLVQLSNYAVNKSLEANVIVKLESFNPAGCVKERIALAMIEDAEAAGILKPGVEIIEPTSGNTGIGLALVAAVKGYKLTLTMPETMSIERRNLLKALGANLVLTPGANGMKGAIAKANELAAGNPDAWIPSQFDNAANIEAHKQRTAQEILADFPDGIDYLITGVGTGGHISGVSEVLKQKFPNLKTFAVEPELSPVISGGNPGPHPIQGIGAGFIPVNLKKEFLDGVIQVSKDEAFDYARRAAKEEGLFIGISSGASLAAVAKKIAELPAGSKILTFSYDTGERYLSIDGLF